jgi:CRP-like cAMP-binding protein
MDNLEKMSRKSVTKGEVLLRSGDISTVAYKVERGCLKSYVIDMAGKEHILQFAPEGWIVSDMDSFTNQRPSVLFIDAVEDSVISLIYASELDNLKNWDKEFLIEMNGKLRNSLIAFNKRLINLLSATAEKRYDDFIRTYPTLVQRIPLKLIASYIGITPEYLSEIRRKITKK